MRKCFQHHFTNNTRIFYIHLVLLNAAGTAMVPNFFLDIITLETWRKGIYSLKIYPPRIPLYNNKLIY